MKYPQSVFAQALIALVPTTAQTVVDAPCGSGHTTFDMARAFPKIKFTGVDIDCVSIANARNTFELPNLKFFKEDLHLWLDAAHEIDVFCLVNSLFLLNAPEELLGKIKEKLSSKGRILVIMPNLEGENFKRFQARSPLVNKLILSRGDYETYFLKLGLKLVSCEGIVKVHTMGRWDTKLLFPIRNFYLNWLERRSTVKTFNYFIAELVPEL